MSDIHWSRAAILRLAIASIALIAALFLFVFPTTSLLHQREQNAKLSEETKRVVSDDEIERLARSRFNMVRPGEQAWAIVPGPTTTTTPPSTVPTAP